MSDTFDDYKENRLNKLISIIGIIVSVLLILIGCLAIFIFWGRYNNLIGLFPALCIFVCGFLASLDNIKNATGDILLNHFLDRRLIKHLRKITATGNINIPVLCYIRANTFIEAGKNIYLPQVKQIGDNVTLKAGGYIVLAPTVQCGKNVKIIMGNDIIEF